jgi:anti-sigma-K factor RskA
LEEHVLDLIAFYALGCLDEDEISQVELHLVSCEICQSELRAYKLVVDDLPLAIREFIPPKKLKGQILDRTKPDEDLKKARSIPFWERIFSNPRTVPAWSLLSLSLILILTISNIVMWQRFNSLRNKSMEELIAVNLISVDASPETTGLIIMSPNGDYGTLVVNGLSDLGIDRQYQLWLIRDGIRTSGGVFSVSHEGYASMEIISSSPLNSFSAYGITIEPFGGSAGPTGEKVLGGNL